MFACTRLAAAAIVGVSFWATGANAAPVDDFLLRLNAYLAPIGGSVQATVPPGKSKGAVVLTGAQLISPNGAVPLGTSVSIGNVTTLPGDLILADSVVIAGFDHTADGVRVAIDTITLTNVLLPPPGTTDPMLLAQMLGAIAADGVAVTDNGLTGYLDRISLGVGFQPEIGTLSPTLIQASMTLKGLLLNEPVFDGLDLGDLPGTEVFLKDKKVDATFGLIWDIAAGTLTVPRADLAVPNLGLLQIAVGLNGVTMPLMQELVAFGSEQMSLPPDEIEQRQEAIGLKLLAQLGVVGGSISLRDQGIVAFALAGAASEMGSTAEAMKSVLLEGLETGLSEIGASTAFRAQVVTTVAAFLDQGGLFGIDALPANPASLIELVALAQSPAAVMDRLAVTPVHLP